MDKQKIALLAATVFEGRTIEEIEYLGELARRTVQAKLKNKTVTATYEADPYLRTVERNAFNEGYMNGYHWPKEWGHRPGGPFVWKAETRHPLEVQIRARRSQRAHEQWMTGWDAGNADARAEGHIVSRDDHQRVMATEWSLKHDRMEFYNIHTKETMPYASLCEGDAG